MLMHLNDNPGTGPVRRYLTIWYCSLSRFYSKTKQPPAGSCLNRPRSGMRLDNAQGKLAELNCRSTSCRNILAPKLRLYPTLSRNAVTGPPSMENVLPKEIDNTSNFCLIRVHTIAF